MLPDLGKNTIFFFFPDPSPFLLPYHSCTDVIFCIEISCVSRGAGEGG